MLRIESDGTIVMAAGRFSARGGRWRVRVNGAVVETDDFVQARNVQVSLDVDRDHALHVTMKNVSSKPIRLNDFVIEFPPSTFDLPRSAREHLHLVHPWNFDTNGGVKFVHLPTEWCPVDPESALVGVYTHAETRESLLIGAVPPWGSAFTWVSTVHERPDMEGRFGIRIRFDFEQQVDPGESVHASPVAVLGGALGEELLSRYGELIRSRMARTTKPTVTGWNSWDYCAGAVSRADMDENIRACRNHFGDRIDYIVIDEGWECQWGVWEPNWKFPQGLNDFCDAVKQTGYRPGIWTAPLMVNVYTPLYRAHPDWFVGDAAGNVHLVSLSYGLMAQLDITHPEVRGHVREVFTHLRACGFEYFKVDFTQMVLEARTFHDPRVGRADIIRNLFQLIRECIGEASYLLACGAPYESVMGIADSHRTTGDIHNFWGQIVQNIRVMLIRTWMQGNIGNTDPDFLIVRCSETSDDRQLNRRLPVQPRSRGVHWQDGAEMNLEEAKVLAAATWLMGGDLVLGDAVGKLNERGIELIQKVLPALARPARPVNLFVPGGMECPVLIGETQGEQVVAAFNLTDAAATPALPEGFSRVRDVWTSETQEIAPDRPLVLKPRSVRILQRAGKD